jgi:hypothetical protein
MSLTARTRLWTLFQNLYDNELSAESPRVTTPSWLKTPLLPHQQAMLAAAIALERGKSDGIEIGDAEEPAKLYTSYGILGDRVGSGKSLTALALVRVPPPSPDYVEFQLRNASLREGRDVGILRKRNQLRTDSGIDLQHIPASLFIIPHALMGQWETYAQRDTDLTVLYIKRKADALSPDFLDRAKTVDAVFVSSSMWSSLKHAQPLHRLLWNRVFVDEADTINITSTPEEVRGLFYWFISASWLNLLFANGAFINTTTHYSPPPHIPQRIIDRIQALQMHTGHISIPGCRHTNFVRLMCAIPSQINMITINHAMQQSARLVLHSSDAFLRTSFTTPVVTHVQVDCTTPSNIHVLDSFISAEMMERLHAGDVHGALDHVGIAAKDTETLVESVTRSLERDLRTAKAKLDYKTAIEYSSPELKEKALEACHQAIASIESRIRAIKDRVENAAAQTCPICYGDVDTATVVPCCKQLFCFECLCRSLKHVAACPLCRTRIEDLKTLEVLGSGAAASGGAAAPPAPAKLTKKNACMDFLTRNPAAKTLIFSNYDASFTGLESSMEEAGISYATVTGSQARIGKVLHDFEHGKYRVLFLNARNMGAGLNIEAATHVILFHRMCTNLQTQILGRAMRLGRTAPLTVLHLLHSNERSVVAPAGA